MTKVWPSHQDEARHSDAFLLVIPDGYEHYNKINLDS